MTRWRGISDRYPSHRPAPPELMGPCVPDAAGKCLDCGTTLKTDMDLQTHFCAPEALPRRDLWEMAQ